MFTLHSLLFQQLAGVEKLVVLSRSVNIPRPNPSSVQVAIATDVLMSAVSMFPAGHADEDARLVRRARDGDRAAFTRLYERYARMIHGLLVARVPRPDVDDLVQDVFLAAWDRLASLRDPAAFGGWLATIARNRAADFHRATVEATELTEDLGAPDRTPARTDALAVLAVIRGLPEAYRDTLVLRLVEGMTGPEISVRTGLTEGSVRVNLHRGMKLLREKLGR